MSPPPIVQHARRLLRRHARSLLLITILTLLEIFLHVRSFSISRPANPVDPPFARSCQTWDSDSVFNPVGFKPPADAYEPRENATIVMLARNSDLKGAVDAVRSLEAKFNRWFNYPYVFLNDKPFTSQFIHALQGETSGDAVFEQVPSEMWSWPTDPATGKDIVNRKKAEQAMEKMAARGLPYAANENYHHMCRFYSGFFFDHPALAPYKWYWRLEPEVQYTCDIPYDPFRHMRITGKRYGYVMALWEVGSTAPSLFRTATKHMTQNSIAEGPMWRSLIEPSTAPLPFRWFFMSLASLFHSRTNRGDPWSLCHFWSNFEIADLDFFRSDAYRSFFRSLDRAGGFYHERWGDAPVHSLAAAMFLQPEELHWFSDVGYVHPPLQYCPLEDTEPGTGCGCRCGQELLGPRGVPDTCLRSLRRAVEPG